MNKLRSIKVIVFDADDTLWALQNFFDEVEQKYCDMLSDYGNRSRISKELLATETKNIDDLGYGCKAFIISMIENAIKVSGGEVCAAKIESVIGLGKSLLHIDAKPLDGVVETLKYLYNVQCGNGERRYRLVLFTKGDLLDQEKKLQRSGLREYFDAVRIVSSKTIGEYRKLCQVFDVTPEMMMMVGNSFKSDIAPALEAGFCAAHIPFFATWAHENVEEYEHAKLYRLNNIRELMALL